MTDIVALVERCRDGDDLAWEALVRSFQSRVYSVALHYLREREEARDIAQDVFVRVVQNAEGFKEEARFATWAYTIASNDQLLSSAQYRPIIVAYRNGAPVRIQDVGAAKDAQQIQTNLVRVDGQPSVYLPVLKQGGDTNTIAVVDGIKDAVQHLFDVPKQLISRVVFDQSVFVKTAIETLLHEGGIGLLLTSIMILVFLGSMRATVSLSSDIQTPRHSSRLEIGRGRQFLGRLAASGGRGGLGAPGLRDHGGLEGRDQEDDRQQDEQGADGQG